MEDQLLNQISKDIVDSVLPAAQEDLAKMEQAQVQNAVVSEKTLPSEKSPERRPTPPPSPVSVVEDIIEVKKVSPDTAEKTADADHEHPTDNVSFMWSELFSWPDPVNAWLTLNLLYPHLEDSPKITSFSDPPLSISCSVFNYFGS